MGMRLADAEELATYLLRYDAVTFLRYLETLRVAEGRESVWLYTDAAHTIFEQAKRAGHALRKNDGKKTPGAAYPPSARGDDDDVEIVREVAAPEAMRPSAELDMVLEPMPKWPLLEEILAEIDADKAKLRRARRSSPPRETPTPPTSPAKTTTATPRWNSRHRRVRAMRATRQRRRSGTVRVQRSWWRRTRRPRRSSSN